MLARYTMYRGPRPGHDPLPMGLRQDTRKHTQHCLRPAAELVRDYLASPGTEPWAAFRTAYLQDLEKRYRKGREAFDRLAELASDQNVFLGCSCPTQKNPDVGRCHTVLALEFMREKYPDLRVVFP